MKWWRKRRLPPPVGRAIDGLTDAERNDCWVKFPSDDTAPREERIEELEEREATSAAIVVTVVVIVLIGYVTWGWQPFVLRRDLVGLEERVEVLEGSPRSGGVTLGAFMQECYRFRSTFKRQDAALAGALVDLQKEVEGLEDTVEWLREQSYPVEIPDSLRVRGETR